MGARRRLSGIDIPGRAPISYWTKCLPDGHTCSNIRESHLNRESIQTSDLL
jgi:hypothetical protein